MQTVPDWPSQPEVVTQAERYSRQQDFDQSCCPEVGRVLRTMTAQASGPVLELGSGCGVGSAWMLSGLRPGQCLVTIDRDADRQAQLQELFQAEDVTFMSGDWREALAVGPFGLVFVDVGGAKDDGMEAVIAATSVGGVVVLDDFEPGPLFKGEPDGRWLQWMHHPDLAACEVLVDAHTAMILATRVR